MQGVCLQSGWDQLGSKRMPAQRMLGLVAVVMLARKTQCGVEPAEARRPAAGALEGPRPGSFPFWNGVQGKGAFVSDPYGTLV